MRKIQAIATGFACLGALLFAGEALAKARRHAHHAPLEVTRRSFLDPGTKVPVGSTQNYMVYQTYYHQDPITANQRSWYMNETLPQRLYQPNGSGIPLDLFD
jgi:hypothetical protein